MFMRKPDVMSLSSGSVPEGAFISQYSTTNGGYSDCYYVDIQKEMTINVLMSWLVVALDVSRFFVFV